MLIVCPAGLMLQWHDEMRDKFGLDFRIIDAGGWGSTTHTETPDPTSSAVNIWPIAPDPPATTARRMPP